MANPSSNNPATDNPTASQAQEPLHTAATTATTADIEIDADLDMEDDPIQGPRPPSQTRQDTSSTLDHESKESTQQQQQKQQQQQQQHQQHQQTQQTQQTQQSSSVSNHGPPPNRKDASLREFLDKMDDYAPIIPDAVTSHYLTISGLPPPNPSDPTGATTNSTPLPLARLLALATQKFIADIAADAYQYSRIRASNTSSGSGGAVGAAGSGVPGVAGAGGVPGASGGVGDKAAATAGAAGGGGGAGAGGKAGAGGMGAASQLGVARSGYGGGGMGASVQGRTVLTMEDLGMAVGEYGVNIRRGEFYR